MQSCYKLSRAISKTVVSSFKLPNNNVKSKINTVPLTNQRSRIYHNICQQPVKAHRGLYSRERLFSIRKQAPAIQPEQKNRAQ